MFYCLSDISGNVVANLHRLTFIAFYVLFRLSATFHFDSSFFSSFIVSHCNVSMNFPSALNVSTPDLIAMMHETNHDFSKGFLGVQFFPLAEQE